MKCPNCHSERIHKKGKRAGKQIYKCLECRASFTEGIKYKPQEKLPKVEGIHCPQCGSTHIRRNGKHESGSQRYTCTDCRSTFSNYTLTGEKTYKNAVIWKCPYCKGKLVRDGITKDGRQKYLCKNCNRISTENKELGRPLKGGELTVKQKELIIKYGVYLNVPISQIAQYIPCKIKTCSDLIKKYKAKLEI